MKTLLDSEIVNRALSRIGDINDMHNKTHPGESSARQAVHTVYGGAQIFKAETAQRLGEIALASFQEYAPDFVTMAKAMGFPNAEYLPENPDEITDLKNRLEDDEESVKTENEDAWLAYTVYKRVLNKLINEPVEDFRIDFEDGYGNRPDAEEDNDAVRNAKEVAKGMRNDTLPPFIGIRIKPFTPELKSRSVRTLQLFLQTLISETGNTLPDNFVVTIPKIVSAEEVSILADLLEAIEDATTLESGSLKIELMIETPQSLIANTGEILLPKLIPAAKGRCVSAHFGVYDYTASVNITAAYQSMDHEACDFARHIMKVSFAQTGINISDGATNIMPVGPHRANKGSKLKEEQTQENFDVVHRAWNIMFNHVNHSLKQGYYQGWDLHPAQFPVRYAAVYLFFLKSLKEASLRLKTFVERAAQATLVGDVFDDAATGQGLLNYFLRGLNCGAITPKEAESTGLSIEEIQSRSFVKILKNKRTTS